MIKKLLCWFKTKHEHHKKTEWLDFIKYECWLCGYTWHEEKDDKQNRQSGTKKPRKTMIKHTLIKIALSFVAFCIFLFLAAVSVGLFVHGSGVIKSALLFVVYIISCGATSVSGALIIHYVSEYFEGKSND